MTYSNACYAAMAGVNVAYEGTCIPTCSSNTDCNIGEYCAKDPGDCDGTGTCEPKPEFCPDVWDPVCTCDGMTYSNACYAAMAGVNVAYEGTCIPTCSSNMDCNIGEYCAKDPGDCDGTGTCEPKPEICPTLWDPVCGCDGMTYGNVCEAELAGVNVAHEGECETPECVLDSDCDDGLYCNGIEVCVSGVCESGTSPDCSAYDNQCNDGICDESSDQCVADPFLKEGTACDDGQFCTTNDVCLAGICGFGESRDCSAFDNICNVGVCDEVSDQCIANPDPYEGQPCDDGIYCNGMEICTAGVCEPRSPVDCDDGVSCTIDLCNEETDSCDNPPDDALCDNGMFCDGIETCDVLLDCQAGAFAVCSALDDQCNVGICDEINDQCVASPKADSTPCDNGLFCTTNDVCMVGICTSGNARDCSVFSDQCNVGICDEINDQCVTSPKADSTPCDNGLFCTTNDVCMVGICTSGNARDCSVFSDQCNIGICDEASDQCVADPYPKEGISCDDGDTCTIGDTCQLGICSGTLDETDSDEDGIPNCTDICPFDADDDIDQDGVCGDTDNCPSDFNPDQIDSDGDGIGDVCENTLPNADVGGPYCGDEGTIITFNASSSSDPDEDDLYYRWDLDNDGTWDTDYSPEPTTMHVWYDDYIGTIVLEVSDGEKTDTVSTTITISNVDPIAFIDLILPEFFVLQGDTLLLIGSLTDPGTFDTHLYEWNFDDDSITLDNSEVSHVYLQPGEYNVSLTITDDDGGIGTKNVIIEVISLQEALETIKETIDSLETCYKLKKVLKIHLELAIKFLNKADRYRTNGKEKLALIMQWVAKLQLRIFQKIIYVFERKEWITIDNAELLIAMTNRIIPKIDL